MQTPGFLCYSLSMEAMEQHARYMRLAIEQAKEAARIGEVPIGAVAVDACGQLAGMGFNQRETWKDPTAHAEMLALREAARRHGDWRLVGFRLYVTVEPCIMCAGAIQLSRIGHLIFGAANPKGGALESITRLYDLQNLNHYPMVTSGILGDECAMMLADFFRERRR